MFTTSQDYFKATQDAFAKFPKTPQDVKALVEKTQAVVTAETENVKQVIATYNRATTGDASINEITEANKKTKELFVAARFAAVMALPGAIFALPLLAKAAEEYNVDFIPTSVKKEFNI
jgi:hypothetical protein